MRLTALDDATLLAPREDLPFVVTVSGDRLRLRRGGIELEMPAWTEPAVRALLCAPVRLGDLPGDLDASSRRVLAGRLVREGMIVARPAPS
jgi:hypothetical protein